jgi:hypothetical protein
VSPVPSRTANDADEAGSRQLEAGSWKLIRIIRIRLAALRFANRDQHAPDRRHEVCGRDRMTKSRRKPENSSDQEAGQQFGGTAVADRERVAIRAYELYMARGCGEGQDLDDWLCAERELNSPATTEAADRGRDES